MRSVATSFQLVFINDIFCLFSDNLNITAHGRISDSNISVMDQSHCYAVHQIAVIYEMISKSFSSL